MNTVSSLSPCPVFFLLFFVCCNRYCSYYCMQNAWCTTTRCRSAAEAAHENHEWNFFNDWWMIINVRTLIERQRDSHTDTHALAADSYRSTLFYELSKIGILFCGWKKIANSLLDFCTLVITDTKLMNISWLSFWNGFMRRRQVMWKKNSVHKKTKYSNF